MKSFATRFPQVILQTVISSCSSRPARLSLNEGSQALEDVCSDVARRKNCIGRHVHTTICLKVLALSLKEKEVLSSRANKKRPRNTKPYHCTPSSHHTGSRPHAFSKAMTKLMLTDCKRKICRFPGNVTRPSLQANCAGTF